MRIGDGSQNPQPTANVTEAELYSLEVTVISEGQGGAYLFNDHCWKAEGNGLYIATRGKQSWKLVHY